MHDEKLFQELLYRGWIYASPDVSGRKREERASLLRCLGRKGYLAMYDTAIRYCCLWLLDRGYDIIAGKVHSILPLYLMASLNLNEEKARRFVLSRHSYKYNGTPVCRDLVRDLEILLQQQSTIY